MNKNGGFSMMVDFYEKLDILEDGDNKVLTKKDLLSFGFNDYFIRKAIMIGRMKRGNRGEYQVVRSEEKNLEQQSFSDLKKEDIKESFWHVCRRLEEMLDTENYQDAFEFLKERESCFSSSPDLFYFFHLLSTYLRMTEMPIVLTEYDLSSYQGFGNDFEKVLKSALSKEDYLNAYKTIGKCIYYHSDNRKYYIYRQLLQKVSEQNKKNQMLQKNEKSYHSKSNSVSLASIASFIYDRRYDEAHLKIQEYKKTQSDIKTVSILERLLRLRKCFADGSLIYQEKNCHYEFSSSEEIFKHFFEALRYHDYYEAYASALICQAVVDRRGTENNDFDLYVFLLSDILDTIEINREKAKQVQREKNIDQDLERFIFEVPVRDYDINFLFELVSSKYELCENEEKQFYLQSILNLLETIQIAQQYSIDSNYFAEFPMKSKKSLSNFLDALQVGDYVVASRLIFDRNWNTENANIPYKKYFIFLKKLLGYFCQCLQQQSHFSLDNELTFSNDISSYDYLKECIEKCKFSDAYAFYFTHSDDFSKDLQKDLNNFFVTLLFFQESKLDESFEPLSLKLQQ